MNTLYAKDAYTIKDIEDLIAVKAEESYSLEFKAAAGLQSLTDGVKKEIGKDVAAFANANGGVIIYGLKEKDHKADCIDFINGNVLTKETLENIIGGNISPMIKDLQVIPLRENGDIQKTVYIVKIPRSVNAPHMSNHTFYKRLNFKVEKMEEYEVKDLYFRHNTTKLTIAGLGIVLDPCREIDNHTQVNVIASIQNEGNNVEKTYKLNIYFNCNSINHWKLPQCHYTRLAEDRLKVTFPCNYPIFPKEAIDIARISFAVPNYLIDQLVEESIDAILYFSDGEDERSYTIKESLIKR